MTDTPPRRLDVDAVSAHILEARRQREQSGQPAPKPRGKPMCRVCPARITAVSSLWFVIETDVALGELRYEAGRSFVLCPDCAALVPRRRVGELARRSQVSGEAVSDLTAALLALVDAGALAGPLSFAQWASRHGTTAGEGE